MTPSLYSSILVMTGASLGALMRYGLYTLCAYHLGQSFIATALVNILGSFIIGFLYIALTSSPMLSTFLLAGLLGGFTTFSTFSLDAVKLILDKQFLYALSYCGVQLILGLSFCLLGVRIGQYFLK